MASKLDLVKVLFALCLLVGSYSQEVEEEDANEHELSSSTDETETLPLLSTVSSKNISYTENENTSQYSETSTVSDINETHLVSSSTEENVPNKTPVDTDQDIILTGTSLLDEVTNNPAILNHVSSSFATELTQNTTIKTEETTETNQPVCIATSCRNGGECVEDEPNPSGFYCECLEGYVGIRCGTIDNCRSNDEGILCNKGGCIYSADGLERSCECLPGMYWNEEEAECQDPDPPCFPNPCQNGGTCVDNDDTFSCNCASGFEGKNCTIENKCGDCINGQCILNGNIKRCMCNEGFYWNEDSSMCEVIMPPCLPNPCKHGGYCDALSEEQVNCTCSKGFSGHLCEVEDLCSNDDDCIHGVCILSFENTIRKCKCDSGYFLDEEDHVCKEIRKPCEPNPCLNDGICTAISENAFNCTCSEGFTGSTCQLRDKCKMDWGKVHCQEAECNNNFDLGIYYCPCGEGQYFSYSQRKCLKLDLCPLMKCKPNEECVDSSCRCKDNYKWDNETGSCKPDFCSSNPCPSSDMLCKEGLGSTTFKCSCEDGYAFNGAHCIKAFCSFPNLNDCDQICTETDKGYVCECKPGFELDEDNRTCIYLANETCTNKTCSVGFCIKDNEDEECICPPGYIEMDGDCVDLCSAGQISAFKNFCPSEECETPPDGGFRCKCEGKYVLSEDKTTCAVRNVCLEGEIGWKTCSERNAECVQDWNYANGFQCKCKDGEVAVAGVCTEFCEIEANKRHCSQQAALCGYDEKRKMSCTCPPYFKMDQYGICNMPADASYTVTLPLDKTAYQIGNPKQRLEDSTIDFSKILNDVSVTTKSMFETFKKASILSCRLSPGYITCKIEMQFTGIQEIDLKRFRNKPACIDEDKTGRCLLPPSLVLVKGKIDKEITFELTDPCDADIKEDACGSETTCSSFPESRSFNCSCKPGFAMRKKTYPFQDTLSFIEECKDINECTDGSNPCPVNSNCKNTIGSFLCSCKNGYRRVRDDSDPKGEKCIELCNPNPCTHGQCLSRGDHEFSCKCDVGYGESLCDLHDEHFKRAQTNTIIVGAVLGGVLLLTFILFFVYTSRLKKQKQMDDPNSGMYNSSEMVTPF